MMKKILAVIAAAVLFANVANAAEGWSTMARTINYVTSYHEASYFVVDIGTSDGRLIYRTNCGACSMDGAKAVLATALSAKASGDNVFFYYLSTPTEATPYYPINCLTVGGRP